MSDSSAILVLCTCPDQDSAENISQQLITTHAAACVNMIPGIRSCYRWQGQVETGTEVLLLIKTVSDRYERLQETILELHPYELPEIIAVPIEQGHQAYLDWITENTAKP